MTKILCPRLYNQLYLFDLASLPRFSKLQTSIFTKSSFLEDFLLAIKAGLQSNYDGDNMTCNKICSTPFTKNLDGSLY